MGFFNSRRDDDKRRGLFDRARDNRDSNAPMEKYLRENERRHGYDCPHDDPYDCDGGCF